MSRHLPLLVALLAMAVPGRAQGPVPAPLRGVAFDQRLGEAVPGAAAFRDEAGEAVRLADYLGRRPVVLALVYYDCPMLCTLVLKGLASGLKVLDLKPGEDFEVLAVSFAPEETPAMARAAEAAYLPRYGRAGAEAAWHFLTGEAEAIRALTEAVGFRYTFDPETGQYAHAAGLVVLTPEGRVGRYLYGIEYAPRDLRLALVEASEGRIGSLVDQLLLFCFHYDPATGKYSAAVLNLVRLAGAATVLILALAIAAAWRRDRSQASEAAS